MSEQAVSSVAILTKPLLPAAAEPLRTAIRRMRWFVSAFRNQITMVGDQAGIRFDLDERKLAMAFVRWLRAVEAQKPHEPDRRRAYFDFAAGLMLRELMRNMPLSVVHRPDDLDAGRADRFWPEGFACMMFCINIRAAVMAQEFEETTQLAPVFFDIRHWWSFRENVQEDSSTAIGFFDLFIGHNPNWDAPKVFISGLPYSIEDRP